jgi:hypothetical protein
MTFPHSPQPGPRPAPPPGGFRPPSQPVAEPAAVVVDDDDGRDPEDTGHPAVDASLRSLANAAALAPGEQIAAYEAAHQVLQETLASIDR